MQNHCCPAPSAIVERSKFHDRYRQPGESISDYVAVIRGIAQKCNFGEEFDKNLRDRLITGVQDVRIKRSLMAQGDKLDFKKALEIAQAMELADKHAREIAAPGTATSKPVHQVHVDKRKQTKSQSQTNSKAKGAGARKPCYRCGKNEHNPNKCWARNLQCNKCHRTGHIAAVCHSKAKKTGQVNAVDQEGSSHKCCSCKCNAKEVNVVEPDYDDNDIEYSLFNLESTHRGDEPIRVDVVINDKQLSMELDTGAGRTIMSEATYKKLWGMDKLPLQPPGCVLNTYTQSKIPLLGSCDVVVSHNGQQETLPLLVVKGDGANLLGRDWLQSLKLDWSQIFSVNSLPVESAALRMSQRHPLLFAQGLGELTEHKVSVAVEANAKPRFHKARPVPFALKERVEAEIDRLESTGVIKPVTFSRWAAPIVPVVKASGKIRICGDYKTTVNQVATPDLYPLPRVEELFAAMSGGAYFTKLDLSDAYQQLVLDEESQELLTINTSKGLYRYTRLPYGVSAAPSIFQRTMDSLLAGIPKTVAFLDDILVTGSTEAEHWANVEVVLTKLEEAGLRLNRDKCEFGVREVVYLGHRMNVEGLQPTTEKVDAVVNAPVPRNVSELKSYLGLINYYAKFLPQLSTTLAPLHYLQRKNTKWHWRRKQQAAFEASKKLLISAEVLVHFDVKKDLILSCDASPYGVGAVLAHRMPDGSERPVAYASRSLNPAERNYSHLDKEGVAVIFGVKKFHQYLYGRPFTITTDHKPLLGLFSEFRAVPQMASSRLQRWSLTLSAYQYKLVYRPGQANGNADGLSRLPLPVSPSHTPEPQDYVFVMDHLESTAVNPDRIRLWTGRDPVLSQVRDYVMNGWPRDLQDNDFKPYFTRADELSIHSGCLMWGSRVIIPPQGREFIVNELHETHPGISRMKALARSYVWWPNMDKELENKVKHCGQCQVNRKAPPVAPLHPWEWPQEPWERLHLDYAGPFMGHMFLVIVDAQSKWVDIYIVNQATSKATIDKLRTSFATHGLPRVIVTDNGSNFTSTEFEDFLTQNGIKHIKSAPFHPSSNGLAERAVQSFKNGMKKMGDGSVETKLSRYLMRYRITPHTTTGASPAELLMKRKPRCRLDLVRPSMESRVRKKQMDQKANHDKGAKLRTFQVDDKVYVKNFARGAVWVPGVITAPNGPLSYLVKLHDGRIWKRHVDHVRARWQDDQTMPLPQDDHDSDHDWDFTDNPPVEEGIERLDPGHGQLAHSQSGQSRSGQSHSGQSHLGQGSQTIRRSHRSRKAPDRLGWDN